MAPNILATYMLTQVFLDWAQENWQRVYDAVLQTSRHSLSQWRLALHDDITMGHVGKPRHWLHGRQRLPLLTLGDQTLVHPQHVGEALREA